SYPRRLVGPNRRRHCRCSFQIQSHVCSFAISCLLLVMEVCLFQALLDQGYLCLWCCDASRRLLLEGMQGVDDVPDLYRVHGAVCASFVIVNNFQDPSTTKTLQRLCRGMLASHLGKMQRISKDILDVLGECL